MTHVRPDRGFSAVTVQRGDSMVQVARFTCEGEGCTAVHDQTMQSSKINPEWVAKRAARDGWQVAGRRSGRILCPACQEVRAAAAKGDSGTKSKAMPPIIHDPQQQEIPMTAPPTPAAPPKLPVAKSVQMEPLTTKQRFDVRAMLDKHFDDQAGCYLDGYSDQKIGATLNIPWSHVAQIREAAYGPIRVDPELVGLRNEVRKVEAQIKDMEDHIALWRGDLTRTLTDLKARVAAFEKARAA